MKKHSNDMNNLDDLMKGRSDTNALFKVPEGYFEKLSLAITEKISSEKLQEKPSGWITLPRLAVFAMIVSFVGALSYYLFTLEQENNPRRAGITYEDLINSGFVNQLDEYRMYEDYYAHMSEKSVTNTVEVAPYGDYLIENHIDEYLIESEL